MTEATDAAGLPDGLEERRARDSASDLPNSSSASTYASLSLMNVLLLKLTGTWSRLSSPISREFSGCAGKPNFSNALIRRPFLNRCIPYSPRTDLFRSRPRRPAMRLPCARRMCTGAHSVPSASAGAAGLHASVLMRMPTCPDSRYGE